MNHLGPTSSQPSDWFKSTGYYSRLTISSRAKIFRNEDDFPPAPAQRATVNPNLFAGRRLWRTEMLDLGHCEHQFEMSMY